MRLTALVLIMAVPAATVLAVDGQRQVAEVNDPNLVLRQKWDQAVEILENDKFTEQEKLEHIENAVTPLFDFELMGKLALGKQNWRKLSGQQPQEYIRLFERRLKAAYGDKISLYQGQQARFLEARGKGRFLEIPMELLGSEQKVTVIYKLHRTKQRQWLIYDLDIEGVSLILSWRSQFEDILRGGTVEDLLADLRKPLAREGAEASTGGCERGGSEE